MDTNDASHATPAIDTGSLGAGQSQEDIIEMRLLAVAAVARHHGFELDRDGLRLEPGEVIPSPATLVRWVRDQGIIAKASHVAWSQLLKLTPGTGQTSPIVLLFTDGSAAVLVGSDATRNIVWIRDPRSGGNDAVAVDRLRLSQLWDGQVILMRRPRGQTDADKPFSMAWIFGVVLQQRRMIKEISVASITLSFLTIVPPLLVRQVINHVAAHKSMSTLILISVIYLICVVFETLLMWGRRELILVVTARVDTFLNLHIFSRLLALKLEYFESHPAGQTAWRLMQVLRVRDFLTGKLLGTFLDLFTLLVLLPVLFWLSVTLAWMVVAGSALIAVIIMVFLPAIGRLIGRQSAAESAKSSVLVETVQGIRTVKSMAIEPQRKADWDARLATAGELRLEAGRLANWPQTLITPIERFIERGVLLIGAYFIVIGYGDVEIGSLVAFMILGSRVVQPLVGLARLMEDLQEARAAVAEIGYVLNSPQEQTGLGGMRPDFKGAISFDDVTFTYPTGTKPALDRVNFSIPPGTMLGLVGRSGSGKSTITRLLQGINREYSGFLKIDGADLREINLGHLRRSFGVVMQDNFLFRGTVRDNITANRPGLTIEDAVRAARLAGAEEFIERLPQGYETWVEEGSSNLSGGQKQRLAIARALINDPRLLILDEATSALDPESEALVNANLTRIGRGRTMVIVSHRLSSLVDCDQILVLDKGSVVDCAPHATLLERCSIYRSLWLQQNRHLDPQGARAALLAPVANQGD